MTTGSRGNLAVQEWRKAEGHREAALTIENQELLARMARLEADVTELRVKYDDLLEGYRALSRKLA